MKIVFFLIIRRVKIMFNKRAVGERIYLVIGEVWEFCSCSFYTAYFEIGKKDVSCVRCREST
jgi:hypothetical protein